MLIAEKVKKITPFVYLVRANYTYGESDQSSNGSVVLKTQEPKADNDCANKAYVDEQIGDIDAALDELHNYAQSLAGGGAE